MDGSILWVPCTQLVIQVQRGLSLEEAFHFEIARNLAVPEISGEIKISRRRPEKVSSSPL